MIKKINKKLSNLLFFVLLVILINTCQTPKEPDTEPPVIEIIYPLNNQTIFEEIKIIAEASDNDALDQILFSKKMIGLFSLLKKTRSRL